MTTEQSRIIPIETTDRNYNINSGRSSGAQNNNSDAEDNCSDDPNRKPSYVGLSCAVSGYSNFIRYTSPSRKDSPPQQFRVESGPQVLDNSSMKNLPPVRGQQQSSIDATDLSYYPASHTRKIVQSTGGMTSVETVTKFYNNNNNNGSIMRETSPGSDTSSVGSGGSLSSGGNGTSHQGGSTTLVQKQIERLYGGKMSQMRLTSPEPKSDDSLSAGYSPESGSAADSGSESLFKNSPLELKTLKVPAVFRLLRPEFREQLKNNSCQVKIPTDFSTPTSSRTRSDRIMTNNQQKSERIIPIEVDQNLTKNAKNGSNNSSPEKVVTSSNQWSPTNGNDAQTLGNKVTKSAERIIPVVRDSKPFQGRKLDISPEKTVEKPALPAKPTSPTRTPRSPTSETLTTSTPLTPSTTPPSSSTPTKSKDITSPALVSSLQKASKEAKNNGDTSYERPQKPVIEESSAVIKAEPVEVLDEYPQSDDLDEDEELMEDPEEEGYPCGGQGVRERTLLCPIQEEDTESTASGSSVSVANNQSNKRSTVINNNNNVNNSNNSTLPTTPDTIEDTQEVIQEEVHDGHYFIKILENEIFQFEEQICDFEEDLSNEAIDFSEDVHEELLAAIGKAKLLMSQKLAQFRGLCEKNINTKIEDDPYVPTSEDLAGFWDMVHIQVVHIHTLFAEMVRCQKNGWKRVEVKKSISEPKKEPVKTTKAKTKSKTNGKAGSTGPKTGSGPKSEAAKARDEARRKMLEDRKRQMKLKQQQQCEQPNENEVIFVEF